MFDVTTFKRALKTSWLGREVFFKKRLDSTNTFLKKLPTADFSHGAICITDEQIQGRGQYERDWHSEPQANLTFTLAFKPVRAENLHLLTLACALAVAEDAQSRLKTSADLKWPNDVMLNGQKLGGLLSESTYNGNRLDRFLTGIGLNVNQRRFPAELQETATSYMLAGSNSTLSREHLLAEILQRIEHYYHLWSREDVRLLRRINEFLIGYGDWVRIKRNGTVSDDTYKVLGLNRSGHLTLLSESDDVITLRYEQVRLVTD